MYNFLEEFLFLLDAEDFIFSSVKVKIDGGKLKAEVFGDKASDYKFSNNVKAITYSEMNIREEKGRFIIDGVFDV